MALLWFDGFELDRTSTAFFLGYPTHSSGWPSNFAVTAGRFGGYSLRSVTGSQLSFSTASLPWTTSPRQVYFGIALRVSTPGNALLFSMPVSAGGGPAWEVDLVDLGNGYQLILRDGTTAALFTTDILSYGDWVYIEVKAVSQAGGAWEFRVNGVSLATGTGTMTNSGQQQDRAQILLPLVNSGFIEYDDWYITEDGFLGPSFVVDAIRPVDDFDVDWIPLTSDNYTMVDDPGTSDGDTTYNEASLEGATDLYGTSQLSLVDGDIHAVRWQADARNTDASNHDLLPYFKVEGLSGQGALHTVIGTTYVRVSEILTANPITANPWERGDLSEVKMGFVNGLPVGEVALRIIDQIGLIGYMFADGLNQRFDLYDENNVLGRLPTSEANSKLPILDENLIEGHFPLEVIE